MENNQNMEFKNKEFYVFYYAQELIQYTQRIGMFYSRNK